MGLVKSSSSSSLKKNIKKTFKNRIRGFEKKFYELRILCNVEAAGIVNSGYLRNGFGLLPENSNEFQEVLMRYRNYKIYGNNNKKKSPKIDKLSVESLSVIERDLESMFIMIAEKENQLKGVISSSSAATSSKGLIMIPYCDQDEKKMNFGVSDSTCLIGSSSDYNSASSSSDFNLITSPTAANDMVSGSFSDMNEVESQWLNCSSSSYMEMMNTGIYEPQIILH